MLSKNIAGAKATPFTQAVVNSPKKDVVKKGWLYKKGKSCVGRWKQKWAALYSFPTPALHVYDSRDAITPSYILNVTSLQMEPLESVKSKNFLMETMLQLENLIGGVDKDSAFVLVVRGRKFYFAAESRRERDEWMNCLRQYINHPLSKKFNSFGLMNIDDAAREHHAQSRAEQLYQIDHTDDFSDAESVYSVRSYKSSASRKSGRSRRSTTSRNENLHQRSRSVALSKSTFDSFDNLPFISNVISKFEVQQVLSGHHSEQILLSPHESWNETYQQSVAKVLASSASNLLENNLKRARVIGQFKELAETIFKTNVDNFHKGKNLEFPETFSVGNVIFHMAADYSDDNYSEILNMEKKASCELKAIRAINDLNVNVHTALLTVLDYKGFRAVAYPVMPLDAQKTLVLLLNDERPLAEDQAVKNMNQIASCFNLSPCSFPLQSKKSLQIAFPSTVEMHFVKERGTMFALNLCDMLPRMGSSTYRYRPELMRSLPFKVSPSSSADMQKLEAYLNDRVYLFVKDMDETGELPFDSRSLSAELHQRGINIRQLPTIMNLTKLPHLRQICISEIICRSVKALFKQELTRSIRRYRLMEAGYVEDDLKMLVASFFSSVLCEPQSRKFWNEKLKYQVRDKFKTDLAEADFLAAHKGQLFITMQYHCGVEFDESVLYDFDHPLVAENVCGFVVRGKAPFAKVALPESDDASYLIAYDLARSMLLRGPSYKLLPNVETAGILLEYAEAVSGKSNFALSADLCNLAFYLSPTNHCVSGLARMFFVQNNYFLEKSRGHHGQVQETVQKLIEHYDRASGAVTFHLGENHPYQLKINDRMTHLLSCCNKNQKSHEYLQKSLYLSTKVLGENHLVTASYLKKCGYVLLAMHKTAEALDSFQNSLAIYEQIDPMSEETAESLFCCAEALADMGNFDSALESSKKALDIRESRLGAMNSKTVDSYQQYGKLQSVGYADYNGVITEQIRQDIQLAINAYEKVFKYVRSGSGNNGKGGSEMLFTVVRMLVALRLKQSSTEMKQVIQTVRSKNLVHDSMAVRESILKLVHLTPIAYIDSIFEKLRPSNARYSKFDKDEAMKELSVVLQISERSEMAVS